MEAEPRPYQGQHMASDMRAMQVGDRSYDDPAIEPSVTVLPRTRTNGEAFRCFQNVTRMSPERAGARSP